METIIYMLAGVLIAIVIFGVYLFLIRCESKKMYTMRDLKPQRVDEKGKELCYCISFNFGHHQKQQLIKKYYSTVQEPTIEFMESLAEVLGVSKKWLAKGANVAIFDTDEIRSDLSDILRNVTEAEKIYIAIGKECYDNYLRIILKYNDIKYKCYKKSFIFHVSEGATGQTQLMEVYDFLRKVKAMRNKNGQEIYPLSAYFLSEEQWNNLVQGNMYPAAIRKVKNYKAHIMDDFLDVGNLYRNKERYRLWYGEEFVKCQEYIRERLLVERRDYI